MALAFSAGFGQWASVSILATYCSYLAFCGAKLGSR
jgi:hypothetical protein